ncbi:hypothetical protein BMETH_318911451493, partial [methanotrophic bacterial endosymbiont of Bathymodiolus sp.]
LILTKDNALWNVILSSVIRLRSFVDWLVNITGRMVLIFAVLAAWSTI